MVTAKYRLRMSNPRHLLATGFGAGLLPVMPGTAGSVAAIPVWVLLMPLPWQLYLLILVFAICIGVYICHQTAKDMQIHDHGSIVWDELVGIWVTFIALPVRDCQWVITGFIIFRILDILKPWPICWIDSNIHGGLGIMIDDIISALLSAGIIYLMAQY